MLTLDRSTSEFSSLDLWFTLRGVLSLSPAPLPPLHLPPSLKAAFFLSGNQNNWESKLQLERNFSFVRHSGTRIPAAAMDVLDAVMNGNAGQKTTA